MSQIHPDYEYASKKWKFKYGAITSYLENGPLRVEKVYGKNKLQIFWYNLILKIKWYRRSKK